MEHKNQCSIDKKIYKWIVQDNIGDETKTKGENNKDERIDLFTV